MFSINFIFSHGLYNICIVELVGVIIGLISCSGFDTVDLTLVHFSHLRREHVLILSR